MHRTTSLAKYLAAAFTRGSPLYHYDGLGSVAALSDSAGNTVEKYAYDVYGAAIIRDTHDQIRNTNSVANPYFFTARRFDTETNLYYYRARYYSPNIGRFLQTDPIGYEGGINLYTYCGNNPIILLDPFGLWQVTIEGGCGIAGRITFGSNYGRRNFRFGVGYGLGLRASGTREDISPGLAKRGLSASLGVDISGAADIGSWLSVGGGIGGRTEAGTGTIETFTGIHGEVELGRVISKGGEVGVMFSHTPEKTFDARFHREDTPVTYGWGGMAFAGVWPAGVAWGEAVVPQGEEPITPVFSWGEAVFPQEEEPIK